MKKNAHSPYGIIVHSNQAENVDNPLLAVRFPQTHDNQKKPLKRASGQNYSIKINVW
mgnify:CR=1 FL=1